MASRQRRPTATSLLELIEGLGGEVHLARLQQVIRKSLRPRCQKILLELLHRRLLLRYAPGHYALTKEGREALEEARRSIEVDWLA